MGYCTYGGKMVPGNNQASCIGGGGDWVGGETGPNTQVSMPPIGSPIQLPSIGRPPIRPEPDRGIPGYQAPQYTDSPANNNTNDFGRSLPTNFAGYSRLDAQKQREDALNPNNLRAKFDSNPINQNPGFFESAKMRTRALNNPPKDSMGLFGGTPSIPYTEDASIFGKASITDPVTGEDIKMTGTTEEPLEDATMDLLMVGYYPAKVGGKIVQTAYKMLATPKGILLTGYGADKYFDNKEKADAWVAKQADMVSSKVSSVVKPDEKEIPAKVDETVDTDTPSADQTVPPTGTTGTTPPLTSGTPGAPVNTGKILEGQQGLLQNIQSKDWWMSPTEGGSGAWDNRLFRLGEMMTHMGTPLSKQGENPSKRWTSAAASAATLNAAKAKAGGTVSKDQAARWAKMIPADATLIKQFLSQGSNWYGGAIDPKTPEYAKAAKTATYYKWIANQLINEGIEPAPSTIKKRLDKLKEDEKNK